MFLYADVGVPKEKKPCAAQHDPFLCKNKRPLVISIRENMSGKIKRNVIPNIRAGAGMGVIFPYCGKHYSI